MSTFQSKIWWVVVAVAAFGVAWIWRGCQGKSEIENAVQLSIQQQQDTCAGKLQAEKAFYEQRLAQLGLELLNQNSKPLNPITKPVVGKKPEQDAHNAVIQAMAYSLDSLKHLAYLKLLPRQVPPYPFEFENQFVKVGGELSGTYYPLNNTSDFTHTFKTFEIKEMLEKEVIKEVTVENTRFFHSLSVALHGGYAFEPKHGVVMLELYAKLRASKGIYVVPRYDLRYANADLVRTASLGIDFTIE